MITREADYAIRTLVYLSKNINNPPVTAIKVSEETDVPYRFLRKISYKLVAAGMIATTRGKQGGMYIVSNPKKLSLLDVLKIFDERACAMNICSNSDHACKRSKECKVCERLRKIQTKMHAEFAKVKFSQL